MPDNDKKSSGEETKTVEPDRLPAEVWATAAPAFDSKWEIVKNALEPGKLYTREEVAEAIVVFLNTPAN